MHLLALRGLAVVLVTVRTGEPAPDSVVALWKDGLARRLDLPALAPQATAELLEPRPGWTGRRRDQAGDAAGAPGATRCTCASSSWAGGRAVRCTRSKGCGAGGVDWPAQRGWPSWSRPASAPLPRRPGWPWSWSPGASPWPSACSSGWSASDAVQAAEDGGLLVLERSGRRMLARLAHPLYGEVLRAALPLSRARAVAERLAAAFDAGPLRRRDDLLRVGDLAAGSRRGQPARTLLLEAARQAAARFDHELTERLARAAVDAGGGPTAVRVLAETLEWQGRHAEAVAVMDGEPPAQGAERARWASIRAGNLYWGLERTAEAEEVLQQAALAEEGGGEAVAMLAWILLFDGRLREAVAVAGRVLDRAEAPAQALVWAATAAVPALGSLGRLGEALAVADRGLAVARAHPQELPWGETQLSLVRCQVLLGAGRLAEARAIAEAGYQAAVADRSPERTGGWAGFRGLVAKAEGRIASAEALLREAVALLEEQDPYRFMRWCLAELASVAALAGDQEAAVGWLDRADARGGRGQPLFRPLGGA